MAKYEYGKPRARGYQMRPEQQAALNRDMGLFGQLFKTNPDAAAAIAGTSGGGYTSARDSMIANQFFGGDQNAYKQWGQQHWTGGGHAKYDPKTGQLYDAQGGLMSTAPKSMMKDMYSNPAANPASGGPRNGGFIQPPIPQGPMSTPSAGGPGGPGKPGAPRDASVQYGQYSGFGIPGFEKNPMVGGGSWEGTSWMPHAQRFDMQYPYSNPTTTGPQPPAAPPAPPAGPPAAPPQAPPQMPPAPPVAGRPPNTPPVAPVTPPYSQQSIIKSLIKTGDESGSGTPPPDAPPPGEVPGGAPGAGVGLQIPQAKPYDYSNFTQFYGNHLPPYMNLQQQIEHSMQGIAPAKPGFNWANMGQTGWGGPGWAGMLGFAPPGGRNGNA